MSNILKIRRREKNPSLSAAAPSRSDIRHGELVYDEIGGNLYYGLSSDGVSSYYDVVGGPGTYSPSIDLVNRTTAQDISGVKSFYAAPIFKESVTVEKDLTILGSLSVLGSTTTIDTDTITTSAFNITNYSQADRALTVKQAGSGVDIAAFYDLDDTTSAESIVFSIKNGGKVGVNTDNPVEALTVVGNISASGKVYASDGLEIVGSGGASTTLFVEDGKVGVNTESPSEALSVSGNITATQNISATGAGFTGNVVGTTSQSNLYNFIIDGGTY